MAAGPFVKGVDMPGFPTGTEFDKNFQKKVSGFPPTMGLAVVDLTNGIPRFGVTQENVEKHVFSLAKICLPFAAYRLQERLRNSFRAESAKDIEKAWRAEVRSMGKHIGVDDFPKLDRIFKPPVSGQWSFDFQETNPDWDVLQGLASGQMDSEGAIPKPIMDKLGFLDRLKLAVRMSDDNASGSVISDLGFAFINGTLANEWLYSPQTHGLWVGSSYSKVYANTVYVVEPTGEDITVGGTAYTVAMYMTRLFRGKLIMSYGKYKPDDEIRDMLEEKSSSNIGTYSRFTRGLPQNAVRYSKIGLDYAKASEGAIIERPMKTKSGTMKWLRYVLVALQSMSQSNMPKIAKAVDEYIEEVHKDDK
jgi:hypothetical protein